MSYFKYNKHNIYYEEIGVGEPLLLLHGNTASSTMFFEIAKRFSDIYKVILIDFLGHGKSDRISVFPTDLWFDEAQQVISFLREKKYEKINIIGSSGGALVAINVALESPEHLSKIVADSFEGERPLKEFTMNIAEERARSKENENAKRFYQWMQGEDWEQVVDNDTFAIVRHEKEIGKFFHKELSEFKPDILLVGSKQDEFVSSISPTFFEQTYGEMIKKIGHGEMRLFEAGGHPAMLSNQDEFVSVAKEFFAK